MRLMNTKQWEKGHTHHLDKPVLTTTGAKDRLTTPAPDRQEQVQGLLQGLPSVPPASCRLGMGHATLSRPRLYMIDFCFGCWETSNYHHSLELEYDLDAGFSLLLSGLLPVMPMVRSDLLHLSRHCTPCISLASLHPWVAATPWLKKVAEESSEEKWPLGKRT